MNHPFTVGTVVGTPLAPGLRRTEPFRADVRLGNSPLVLCSAETSPVSNIGIGLSPGSPTFPRQHVL